MITPRFTLDQTDSNVTIKIRAPYCNLRELDVSVDNNNFLFLCKPYYLRLNLPGNIVENDQTISSFDAETGEFTFCYEKTNCGEHFPDLHFITKFLTPKIEVTQEGAPKIVVLTNEAASEVEYTDDNGFGFAMRGHHNFAVVSYEFEDVFEMDPRQFTLDDRRKLRLQTEQNNFNSDHYLADFLEDEEIHEIIALPTPPLLESIFSNTELDFLKDLPNIQYHLTDTQIKYCHNGLFDILFAYCYDRRTTHFESNSESGWTINKLSATLCCLEGFEQPKQAIISAFRRSLIYPLYRNFQLSERVLEDLKELLKGGDEKHIVKCLIEIYHIFLGGDCCRYILNNLFIKDYITYVMKWDKEKWRAIIDKLEGIVIAKGDLGLNLSDIETGDNISNQFSKMSIIQQNNSDDDDDETDDSSSSSGAPCSSSNDSSSDSDDSD